MITFNSSTQADLEQIKRWAEQDIDSDHRNIPPSWWLTGAQGSLLVFRIEDALGPIMYVRMDDDRPFTRLHVQFAPGFEVSKRRLIPGMLKSLLVLSQLAREKGFKGIIYESHSEPLILFMGKLGFKPYGSKENLDDYLLSLEEKEC